MKTAFVLFMAVLAGLANAQQEKLLWHGEYHTSYEIRELDDDKSTASVFLEKRRMVEKIPYKSIPKKALDDARKPDSKASLLKLEKSVQDKERELLEWQEKTIRRMLDDPRKPVLIAGKVISRVSDDCVLVSAKDPETGIPSASGIICLRDYPKAKSLVDDDKITEIGAPDGEYSYTSAIGAKKVVRAYKYAGK